MSQADVQFLVGKIEEKITLDLTLEERALTLAETDWDNAEKDKPLKKVICDHAGQGEDGCRIL